MQRFIAEPVRSVAGTVTVPGDKSISHRALMLGAVAEGTTTVRGFLAGDDCLATLEALRALGVAIDREGGGTTLAVHGVGDRPLASPADPVDLGNSGTGCRLLMGLLAGRGCDVVLTGDESLRGRPMERVAAPLRQMGARIETQDGRAPVRIAAAPRLRGIDCTLPVASAQIKSALLLAALTAQGETVVRSPAPSRDHTERMLAAMGVAVESERDGRVVRLRGPCRPEAATIDVPGDLSSAAFFIVAGCLAADPGFVIENVGVNPTRTGVLTILEAMGAHIELRNRRRAGNEPVADIAVKRSRLSGIDVPPELVPLAIDELPVLFVAAAAASGRSVFSGAEELRHKESDRIGAMAAALAAVGVTVAERPDGLVIEGGGVSGGAVDCRGDHRIAMALSVASVVAARPIEILRSEQVATSFPGFADVAAEAGLAVRVETVAAA